MKKHFGTIDFRPAIAEDRDFLYRVFASTRQAEMTATGWSGPQIESFLQMQFEWQHDQYMQNYPDASFDVVLIDGTPAGKLYVDRTKGNIRIIDIALLPEFRGRGAGGQIMRKLAGEADAEGLAMSLHVETNNPARRLYERVGFKVMELRGIHFYLEREPNRIQQNRP